MSGKVLIYGGSGAVGFSTGRLLKEKGYDLHLVGQGLSMHASLSMSKGAIEGLTRSLAAELAPKTRVNAIAPSILADSNLSSAILKDEKSIENMTHTHALQRLGKAEDIGKLAAFLISQDSDWLTGQIIGVDGGRSVIQV